MRPYFPGGSLNAFAVPLRGSILQKASDHRLGRGLPGYLIPFDTHAFVLERQNKRQLAAFAFGIPHDINGFHPYTMSSANLSLSLVLPFRLHLPG